MNGKSLCIAAFVVGSLVPVVGRACEFHALLGVQEPTGIWPSNPMVDMMGGAGASITLNRSLRIEPATSDPAIIKWKTNATNAKAHSNDATINGYVSNITADVDRVYYDTNYAYIHSSAVPSHNVGPFPGNPAYPSDKNQTYRIPRNPTPAATKTTVGMGNIGVMVNGVGFFDSRDARTYNNNNTWHQVANVFEASSFDVGPGHPAPGMGQIPPGQLAAGTYHYHQLPTALTDQLDPGNTGQHHSPLLGFAFDGYPVYGSWGYANANGSGGIIRETSSYQLRSITQRHTLADGTNLAANLWGPDVSTTYPLGSYAEDYMYVMGLGTLDQYNGRQVVTPEYPSGTYAYFMPLDTSLKNVYPYILGPQYYGVVDTANLPGGSITVPGNATVYFTTPVPEPGVSLIVVGFTFAMGLARRRSVRHLHD